MSLNGKGEVWFDEFKLEKEPIERQDTSYSESTENYISEVVKVIKKHALNKDSLNYKQDIENALKLSNFADDSMFLSVSYLLRKLKDGHTFFSEVSTIQNDSKYDKPIDAHHLPSGKILQDTLAYLKLPTLAVAGDSLYQVYANTLYNTIIELDHHSPKYWIIDLRDNRGGVVWPIMAGLGPLLNEGIQGYFVYSNNKTKPWIYKKGKAYADKDSQWKLKVKDPYTVKRAETKLLVLTDGTTASAAEMIAVMLRGYQNVRVVGKETRGLTSGNASFTLSDGSILRLTTSRYMDKNGKIYVGKIIPDEEVEVGLKNDALSFPFNSLFETMFNTSSTSFMQ